MKPLITLAFLVLSLGAIAQDTLYYTANWTETNYPKVIKYYGIKDYDTNGVGMARYYYTKDNVLFSQQEEANGLKNGICTKYHHGTEIKSTVANYFMDTLHGSLSCYNESGKLYKEEKYDKGIKVEFTTYDTLTGEKIKTETSTIEFPDIDASFPGGTAEMMKYLQSSIVYPLEAIENNIQGKVYINFVVEKDGTINEVEVAHGVSPELDAEAIRVISEMPTWKPGTADGKPVRTKCRVPVVFTLNNGKSSKKKKKRR